MDENDLAESSPSMDIPVETPSEDAPIFPTVAPSVSTAIPTASPTSLAPVVTLSPTQDNAPSRGRNIQASVSYEFDLDVTQPSESEIFRLELATSAFYIGVFSERYRDNPNTRFRLVVARVDNLIYDPTAIPPIEIEWDFDVTFAQNSAIIPPQEEILEVIESDEDTLEEYVDIYLRNTDDVWSSVSRVTIDAIQLESETSTFVPDLDLFAVTPVDVTMIFGLSSGSTIAIEPGDEEYNQLAAAAETFYTALLSPIYPLGQESELATVTAVVTGHLFASGGSTPTLQVNYEFLVYFSPDSTDIPEPQDILDVMINSVGSLPEFIRDFLWVEGEDVESVTIGPLVPISTRR